MDHLVPPFVQALIGLVISALTFLFVGLTGWFDRRRAAPHATVESMTDTNNKQRDILARMLHELGAKRAYLSKFHNGDRYIDGSDILRKSRVVEVTAPGVSHEAERFKAVLISTIPEEMFFIEEDGPGWYVTADLPLSNFRDINEQTGVRAGARVALRKAGNIVAFIGCDFDDVKPPENLKAIAAYATWMEGEL